MKEILSLFLSMIMICSCLTVSGLCAADQSAENFGNYFTYSVSNGNASITGIQSGIVVAFIPSVIDNYPVTTIAGQAFKNNQSLRYLYIPGSVRLIDYEAFCGCPCLEQVILSEGLELDEILCINENCDIIKTWAATNPYISTFLYVAMFLSAGFGSDIREACGGDSPAIQSDRGRNSAVLSETDDLNQGVREQKLMR